jgi:uncharacterized protein HemY
MERESLEKVQDKVFELVDDTSIPILDRAELLINLINFLNPEEYEENIKVLQKKKENHHNR